MGEGESERAGCWSLGALLIFADYVNKGEARDPNSNGTTTNGMCAAKNCYKQFHWNSARSSPSSRKTEKPDPKLLKAEAEFESESFDPISLHTKWGDQQQQQQQKQQ